MSVVSVNQTWTGRSGDAAGIGSSRITRTWLAKTDNRFDTEIAVLNSGLVPVAFVSTLPESPYFLCRNVRASQKSETPFAWDVEAEYSDEPLGKDEKDRQQNPNPLTRPPKISWDSQQYEKPIEKDTSDEAIMNSANDPFDPPPTMDDARWQISITSNVAVVPAFVLTLNNKINSSVVNVDGISFAAKTLKVQGLRISEEQLENDVLFRVVTFQLHFRPETWVFKPLDAGFAELVSGEKREILLDDGTKPSAPWPLDGSGAKLASPTPATAVYLTKNIYAETDLSVLPGVT